MPGFTLLTYQIYLTFHGLIGNVIDEVPGSIFSGDRMG